MKNPESVVIKLSDPVESSPVRASSKNDRPSEASS